MAAIAVHTGRLFQPFHLGVPGNPPSQRHVSVDVEPDPVIPEFVVLPPERERRIHDEHRIHRRMDALVPVVLPGQWVMRAQHDVAGAARARRAQQQFPCG